MIKFKNKYYSGVYSKIKTSIKKDPVKAAALGVSALSLGASGINTATNLKRRKEDKEYQVNQLKAMDHLTKSITKLDKSLVSLPENKIGISSKPTPTKKRSFLPRFLQKNNSHTIDYAMKGAGIGGALGSLGSFFVKHPGGNDAEKLLTVKKLAGITAIGTLIGGALGAVAGAIMDYSEKRHKKNSVNNRILNSVIDDLEKSGFREGEDYTRNPKTASLIKTKVNIVISKAADDFKLIINTINDPKLKDITDLVIKNLPSMSVSNEKLGDRFNEISISTTSSNGNSVFISSICEKFIREGYPVYLIEVG